MKQLPQKHSLYRILSVLGFAVLMLIALGLSGCPDMPNPPAKEKNVVENSIEIDDARIHYVQSGTGKDILLIHGLGGSTYSWRRLRPHFPDYRLTAVDLMGFGESDKPKNGQYTLEHQAVIISQLVAKLGIRDYVIAGHSYGGGVALQTYRMLAGKKMTLPRGLILIDTVAYPQQMPRYMQLLRTRWLAQLTFAIVPRKKSARALLEEIYYDPAKIDPATVNAYAYYLDLPGAQHAMIETAKHIIPADTDELVASYSSISVRTLIVWGKHDRLIPVEAGRRLTRAIKHSHLKVIPDCGHAPHEEMPDKTASIIRDFLQHVYMRRGSSPSE